MTTKYRLMSASKAVLPRSVSNSLGVSYYALLAKLLSVRDRAYEVPGRLFDLRHGVETSNVIQVSDLDIPAESREYAVRYQPTKMGVFREVIRRLPVKDRRRFAFVDFGCGKGRCLLLAADAGFGTVKGIELSAPLCEDAARNAGIFRSGIHASRIAIQCADAAEAVLPDSASLYFFYNPFTGSVMKAAVENIARHIEATAHEAFIAYVNPADSCAAETAGFRLVDSGRCRSEDWAIWHRPAAAAETKRPGRGS